jgi:Cu/Ag efflux protein CusF
MMRVYLTIFLALLVLAACGSSEAPQSEAEPAQETEPEGEPQVFEGVGTVEAVDDEQETVTIAHEEIVGFMAAMTMTFDVAYESILDDIEPGARVEFRLVVEPDGSYFIDEIKEI